jgi:hypothetical protein
VRARIWISGVVVVLLVGALALPAAATIHVVGALVGQAEVGQWFTADQPCDSLGEGKPQGSGVAPISAAPYSREGAWHLRTDLLTAGQSAETPGVFTGTVEICGRLEREPITRTGPVCGISKGFNGQGRAFVFDQVVGSTVELLLYDFGWKEQAGTILPVLGNFTRLDAFGAPTSDVGTAIALVAVSPTLDNGERCFGLIAGNGVKAFEVVAAFALASGAAADWNDITGLVLPKTGDDTKSCFDNGPDSKSGPAPSSGTSYC